MPEGGVPMRSAKCRELLEKIEKSYALCLRRCTTTPIDRVEECLIDCMKSVEHLRKEYIFSGCDESYLPL